MSDTKPDEQETAQLPGTARNSATTVLPTPEQAPQKPSRAAWPIWFGLGFFVLAGGESYLFEQLQAQQANNTTLAVLQSQVADMREASLKTSPLTSLINAEANLAQKQAALAAQVNAMQGIVATDHGALTALQISTQDLGKLTARMAQLNSIAAARMALDAGQPLGVVPNAPAALAVFTNVAPPTMAQLRESFPAAARSAAAASIATNGQAGFWTKVKLRLEGMITISEGERVIFGPPAQAALNRMHAALANDDLAKAIATSNTLSPPVQAAMASWLNPARQLLAARQALAQMVRQQGQ
ncbi:hypothetical protein [Acidocella sp.]|uniref:hypothetical protein n=1 Tax=Acidocella sp. TaxID=50710 RepID=UPI0026021F5E|nr:hypothetical protein [Acidocella sp.]